MTHRDEEAAHYIEVITRTKERAPVAVIMNLMEDHHFDNQTDLVRRDLELVLSIEPSHAIANTRLGRLLAMDGKIPAAVIYFERAYAQSPNDPDVVVNLARSYLDTGRPGDARVVLERAKENGVRHSQIASLLKRAQKGSKP